MHERNVFRTPPDYTELAIKYKSFRQVCLLELNGKVSVNYKNENALRMLTKTLLQEYFQLSVEFAPGSLIPTLCLRLNYILWLEDLVYALEVAKKDVISGVDIGCGSSCIYSLLGAKKNAWHMYALESNEANISYAQENVDRNKLDGFIKIIPQKEKTIIFADLFKSLPEDLVFQFCVCNPPFYDSDQRANTKIRNPEKRAPPHNCHTGHEDELACHGGEVQFVQRIIEESRQFRSRIQIFTTMLGHKSSFIRIKEILLESGIDNICSTEFIQGRTTRWGLAWSFLTAIDLRRLQ